MGKLFEDLKEGFEDILAYRKGKITLKSELIDVPEPPSSYTAKAIKKLRDKCNYSQAIFAKFLNVSIKTVQAWESGERVPNHAALRLLELVDKEIYCPQICNKQPLEQLKRKNKPKTHVVRRKKKTLLRA